MQQNSIARTQFLAKFPTARHLRIACREAHLAWLIPPSCHGLSWDGVYTIGEFIHNDIPFLTAGLIEELWRICAEQEPYDLTVV